MASTFSLTSTSYDGRYMLLECTQTKNVSANTSTISWKLSAIGGNSNYYSTGPTNVYINGVNVYSKARLEWNSYAFPAAKGSVSGTTTVNHDTNGAATITVKFSTAIFSSTVETYGVDKNWTLDTIPRGAVCDSVTCSTNYLNGTFTVKYTPKVASYYYQLLAVVNNNVIKTTNLGKKAVAQQSTTLSFTASEIADKICPLVKNTANVTTKFIIRTFTTSAYTTRVGVDSYKNITVTLPTYCKPYVQTSITFENTNTWLSSQNLCVAGFSKVTVTQSGYPQYYADWKSRSISGGGASSTTNTLVLDPITQSGNITFTSTITDSRGRSSSDSKSITVYKYVNPAFSAVEYKRGTYTNDVWTDSDNGNDLKITLTPTITFTGNTGAVSFAFNNNTVTPSVGATTGLTNGTNYTYYFVGITNEITYNLVISLTDSVGTTSNAKFTIPSIDVTIEFRANGKGIAFFKTSEKDGFECDGEIYYKGDHLKDIVIEEGTTSGSPSWTWRKWSSGIAECWGTYETTQTHYTTVGTGLYGYASGAIMFPAKLFNAPPLVTYSGSVGSAFALTGTIIGRTKDFVICYALSNASGSQPCKFYVQAKGTWK